MAGKAPPPTSSWDVFIKLATGMLIPADDERTLQIKRQKEFEVNFKKKQGELQYLKNAIIAIFMAHIGGSEAEDYLGIAALYLRTLAAMMLKAPERDDFTIEGALIIRFERDLKAKKYPWNARFITASAVSSSAAFEGAGDKSPALVGCAMAVRMPALPPMLASLLEQITAEQARCLLKSDQLDRPYTVSKIAELRSYLAGVSWEIEGKTEDQIREQIRIKAIHWIQTNFSRECLLSSPVRIHARDAILNPSLRSILIAGGAGAHIYQMTEIDINLILEKQIVETECALIDTELALTNFVYKSIDIEALDERLAGILHALNMIVRTSTPDITAYIPININNFHWVSGIFKFNFNADTGMYELHAAELVDSLAASSVGEKAKSLSLGSGVPLVIRNEGSQKDGFRCGDYTCKKILVSLGRGELADLKDESLRVAMLTELREKITAEGIAVPAPHGGAAATFAAAGAGSGKISFMDMALAGRM